MEDGGSKLGIKSWSVEDRPREKLLLKGKEALSNSELLAILLGSGTPKLGVVDLAKLLLKQADDNLDNLSQMSVKDLCKLPGIGEAKALIIIAAAELGRRRKPDRVKKEPIGSSKKAYEYIYPHLADLDHERFFVILLSRSNIPLRQLMISTGGVSATVVDPKLLFKKALENELCSSMILCHNHPSGSLKPSRSDRELTKRLFDAGKLLDISVVDHIIVGHHEYFSFADDGIMPS